MSWRVQACEAARSRSIAYNVGITSPGRMGSGRPRSLVLLVMTSILTSFPLNLLAQSSAEEYSVKAAFLFHFAQFVDWPEGAFKDAGSPLTYCTIGEDPFHGSLDAALNGKTVGDRSLRVQHFKQPQDIRGCHVLFVGTEEEEFFPAILARVRGNSVLTVGESEHFVKDGGMIGFLREENKIRFEINLDSALGAKLKMSSRLLALAKAVIGGQKGT
jgi:hypothetical protein